MGARQDGVPMDTRHHGTEVRLLGPPEVVVGGRRITIGSDKQLALLVALALDAGVIVSAPRLVEALWGEDPPASADKALQTHVSRLRKALGGAGAAIETHPRGYRLAPVSLSPTSPSAKETS